MNLSSDYEHIDCINVLKINTLAMS